MIISVNWLKQFTQIDLSIDELKDVIGARLVEIEGVESLGSKYKDVVIARVIECAPVPDSDHLNLTKIDDGGVVADVERDENGHVQVVCGAPNVREGLLVAWLPPNSTVPETYGDAEPFVLGTRKLRGFMSNGMLASARELDLFDDHDGIVEIDEEVAPGTPFAAPYELDDHLLDIENKSLTHRPDAFGIIGFAREVAAIGGKGFTSPEWYENLTPEYGNAIDSVELSVAVNNPTLSSRYQAVVLGGFKDGAKTPLEIQTCLSRSGIRPISPIVDATNFLMLLSGQPLHAFDYDKLLAVGGSHLHVREGRVDETLRLLDGRTITVTPDDIVIAAGDTAVALAGAMGGADTEIDANTKRVVLESANFNLYNLRRTQMRHGMFSEAVTRFTKGQPAALTAPVLAKAVQMLEYICGAQRISDVADDYPVKTEQVSIELTASKVNGILGTRFNATDIVETLRNVQFMTELQDETITVTAPFWRTDIHIAEDIIEEVGRLNGFDSIEPSLPRRDFTAMAPDETQLLRQQIRSGLRAAGANEVLTYSFVHGDLLSRAGQSSTNAYALGNAISPDLQYYRLSLTPSLLDKVSANVRQKFDEFALFEFGKTHQKDRPDTAEPEIPAEFARVALTYLATTKRGEGRGSAYYTARRYVQSVLGGLHIEDATFVPVGEQAYADAASAPFEPKRSAAVFAGDTYLGIVGEYKRTVQGAFKVPPFSAGFELLLAPLQMLARQTGSYVPLSRFPGSESDVTFAVPTATDYGTVLGAVQVAIANEALTISVAPHDLYVPHDGDSKNITLRFTVVSYDRTLTREDVNGAIERIGGSVVASINGSSIV